MVTGLVISNLSITIASHELFKNWAPVKSSRSALSHTLLTHYMRHYSVLCLNTRFHYYILIFTPPRTYVTINKGSISTSGSISGAFSQSTFKKSTTSRLEWNVLLYSIPMDMVSLRYLRILQLLLNEYVWVLSWIDSLY